VAQNFVMSDTPAYVKNFRRHSAGEPTIGDLDELERELYGASDRAVAIMLGAFVEAALSKYLKAQLRQDMNAEQRSAVYDYDGPLGRFSAKIAMAFAMAAIGPVCRHDLDLIRIIRNGFAHSQKSIKFDDPETAAVCANLKTPDSADATIPVEGFMKDTDLDWSKYADLTKAQNRYRVAVHTISAMMLKQRQQFEMANALAARCSVLP
jgi:DNA-binding MltR family transcriptional regulator